MLEVKIDSKRFGVKVDEYPQVIRDLHFNCDADSFTSIVGPSGCGKTTALKCILGLDTDYTGSITVDGKTDGSRKM